MSHLKQGVKILRKIARSCPNVRWVWVMTIDGLPANGIGGVHYNLSEILDGQDIDQISDLPSDISITPEETPLPMVSTVAYSLGERVEQALRMGRQKFVIVSVAELTMIIFPMGSGDEYFLSIAINGHSQLDEVVEHLMNGSELSELSKIYS